MLSQAREKNERIKERRRKNILTRKAAGKEVLTLSKRRGNNV